VLSVVAVVRLRPIRVLVNDFEGFRQAGLVDQVDTSSWPATVPAVEQLLCEGLELPPGLAVLVGENGTGKSTVVEMLAEACGLNPQGGSAMAKLFRTRDSEPGLGAQLIVERGPARPRWSYFLRADTMHSLCTYLENNPGQRRSGSMSSATGRASWRK